MLEIQMVYRHNCRERNVHRLYQALSAHFGANHVQRPLSLDIESGGVAIETFQPIVAGCTLVIAVVEAEGFNKDDDRLQRLAATAARWDTPIVIVLMDHAETPNAAAAVEALQRLTGDDPVYLNPSRWDRDMAVLIQRLDPLITLPPVPEKASPGSFGRLKKIFSRWFGRPPEAPPSTAKKAEPPRMVERGGSMPESEPADLQEVFLGASAPAALPPGDEFTARFVAYLEDEKDAVEAMLHQLSPRSTSVLGLKRCRWQPGTCVTVSLSGRWLEVEDAQQTFTWDSAYAMLDFDVRLGTDAPQGVTILKFDVAIDGIRVAKLRMDLEVVDHRTASPPKTAVTEAARTAFASYASNDRQRVLDRLASIRISAGLDVFMDCLSLRPGDRWKLELAREIRSRDQFLLFWSHSAATSQWVAWEWQTALSEKGLAEMQIHPLENNVPPPVELSELHFGDVFVAVRDAQAERT
ncbi:hypothetical protein JCM12296A_04020 [Desulfosarcina cetonica]